MSEYIKREDAINLLWLYADESCASVVSDFENLPDADVALIEGLKPYFESLEANMKVMLDPGAFEPTRAHTHDAGLDLYARECQTVPAHGSAIFDTGVHVQLPPFTVGDIDPKSGLYFHDDIITFGTIDEPYRGSIKVKLWNLGDKDVTFCRGDKIAQLVIKDIRRPHIKIVDELDETDRGSCGFGSTGR